MKYIRFQVIVKSIVDPDGKFYRNPSMDKLTHSHSEFLKKVLSATLLLLKITRE